MGMSIYSDFSEEDIKRLSELAIHYTHDRTPTEEIDEDENEQDYSNPYIGNVRDYCPKDSADEEHLFLNKFSIPMFATSTSWATAIVTAAEAAMNKVGQQVEFSVLHLLTCLPYTYKANYTDVRLNDIYTFLSENGLVSVHDAATILSQMTDKDIDSIYKEVFCNNAYYPQVYKFHSMASEAPNRGGLIKLLHDNDPVVALLAINLENFRFVVEITNDIPYKGADEEPTLFAVVSGFDKTEAKEHWNVIANVVPCQSVKFKLPMTPDKELGNYAGIAGYAFGLRYIQEYPEPVIIAKNWVTDLDSNPSTLIFTKDYYLPSGEDTFSMIAGNGGVSVDKFKSLKVIVFGPNSFQNIINLYFDLSALDHPLKVIFKANSFTDLQFINGQPVTGGRRLLGGGTLTLLLPSGSSVAFEGDSAKNFDTVVVGGENIDFEVNEGALSEVTNVQYADENSQGTAQKLADTIAAANSNTVKPTVDPFTTPSPEPVTEFTFVDETDPYTIPIPGIITVIYPDGYGKGMETLILSCSTIEGYWETVKTIIFGQNSFPQVVNLVLNFTSCFDHPLTIVIGNESFAYPDGGMRRRLLGGMRRRLLGGGSITIILPPGSSVTFEGDSGKNFDTVVVGGEDVSFEVNEGALSEVTDVQYADENSQDSANNLVDAIVSGSGSGKEPTVSPAYPTEAPTTQPPTPPAESPTTETPTTEAPTTEAPTTQPPTPPTESPTTETPTTEAPTTEAPTTQPPTPPTESPTTETPTTQPPTTQPPTIPIETPSTPAPAQCTEDGQVPLIILRLPTGGEVTDDSASFVLTYTEDDKATGIEVTKTSEDFSICVYQNIMNVTVTGTWSGYIIRIINHEGKEQDFDLKTITGMYYHPNEGFIEEYVADGPIFPDGSETIKVLRVPNSAWDIPSTTDGIQNDNEEGIDTLDFGMYPNLIYLIVEDNNLFQPINEFTIVGLQKLERVSIGSNCFTQQASTTPTQKFANRKFKITDCPKLTYIDIGPYSFSDFSGEFTLRSVDALKYLRIGRDNKPSLNFYRAKFVLQSSFLYFD